MNEKDETYCDGCKRFSRELFCTSPECQQKEGLLMNNNDKASQAFEWWNAPMRYCERCGFHGAYVKQMTFTPAECPGLPFGIAGTLSNERYRPCFCKDKS